MWVFWLVLAVVVALLIFGLLRSRGQDAARPDAGPRQILQERYARGEIDRDEYHEKLRDLDG